MIREQGAAPEDLLRVRRLTKHYVDGPETVKACHEISLSVGASQFCLVKGPSGSGKSTLLLACAGLVDVDRGSIVVAGCELTTLTEHARATVRLTQIGVVFQDFLLVEEFSALDNVTMVLEARGWSVESARDEAREWLDAVGLAGLYDRAPRQLSGGQRQRVGIARAVVGDRRVIIADEPTGSLDSETSLEIFRLFADLARNGIAVVLASHDPQAEALADRVFLMRDGHLDEVAP